MNHSYIYSKCCIKKNISTIVIETNFEIWKDHFTFGMKMKIDIEMNFKRVEKYFFELT